MPLTIRRDIGGSRLVAFRTPEHYIDVRRDTRFTRYEFAECVRNGRVYRCEWIDMHTAHAPEKILSLIKEELVSYH